MRTERHDCGTMVNMLVSNKPNFTLYDAYWNNKAVKTTSSGFFTWSESNTPLSVESVSDDLNQIVAHDLTMDADALKLQAALLKPPVNSDYFLADSVLYLIFVCLCLYVTVSLVIWGSV